MFPVISALVQDQNSLSRVELSKVLLDMAAPLEKENALELVLPLIRLLLSEEENTDVRLSVIHRLDDFIGVVGLGAGAESELLPLIVRLAEDKKWRVRHAILLLFSSKLAEELGAAAFQQHFGPLLKAAAQDNCALIREDFVVVMGQIAKAEDGRGFGTEWLESAVAPVLIECMSLGNYQRRAVLLTGICVLAGMFTPNTLETKLLPPAFVMAEDKVPNLRIAAAAALRAAGRHVSAGLRLEKVIPRLQMLSQDEDIDVKFEADEALKELEEL